MSENAPPNGGCSGKAEASAWTISTKGSGGLRREPYVRLFGQVVEAADIGEHELERAEVRDDRLHLVDPSGDELGVVGERVDERDMRRHPGCAVGSVGSP